MKMDDIAAGVLFDFGAWLTTRPTSITLSMYHEAGPMVDAITEFARIRKVDLNNPLIFDWQNLCSGEEEE